MDTKTFGEESTCQGYSQENYEILDENVCLVCCERILPKIVEFEKTPVSQSWTKCNYQSNAPNQENGRSPSSCESGTPSANTTQISATTENQRAHCAHRICISCRREYVLQDPSLEKSMKGQNLPCPLCLLEEKERTGTSS